MKARRRKRAMDGLDSVVSREGGAGMVEGARTRERYYPLRGECRAVAADPFLYAFHM